jgi:hypothetical protein
MAGVVSIPWYATVFRGDKFAAAISDIAPIAARYGATDYRVYRQRDDAYRFLQMATFENKADFDRYWNGEEFSIFRADYTGWYQVPVLYQWNDLIVQGALGAEVNGNDRVVEPPHPGQPRGAMG